MTIRRAGLVRGPAEQLLEEVKKPTVIARPRVERFIVSTVQRPQYGGWFVAVRSSFLSPPPPLHPPRLPRDHSVRGFSFT